MIRAGLLCLVLAAAPLAAVAGNFPALYDVHGVAAGDRLNIRAAPDAGAEVLGSLPPETVSIEVTALSADGRWGRINSGEITGWVSTAYLAATADAPVWTEAPLSCSGSEPFWRLDLGGDSQPLWQTPETEPRPLSTGARYSGANRVDITAFDLASADLALTAVLAATRACSDGMSDRLYGIAAYILLDGQDGRALWSGCCSIVAGQ